jgi:predicted DNA-binding transcriptional regulator AlpA
MADRLADHQIIRPREVKKLLGGVDDSTLWRWEHGPQGRNFPRRLKLGGRAAGYVRAEVEQWLRDRLAERETAKLPEADAPISMMEQKAR